MSAPESPMKTAGLYTEGVEYDDKIPSPIESPTHQRNLPSSPPSPNEEVSTTSDPPTTSDPADEAKNQLGSDAAGKETSQQEDAASNTSTPPKEAKNSEMSEEQLKALPAIRITNFPHFLSHNDAGRFFRSLVPLLPAGIQLAYELVSEEEVRALRGESPLKVVKDTSSQKEDTQSDKECEPSQDETSSSEMEKNVDDLLKSSNSHKEDEKMMKATKRANNHNHRRALAFSDRLDCWTSPEGVVKRRIVYLFPRNTEFADFMVCIAGLKILRLTRSHRTHEIPQCRHDMTCENCTVDLPQQLEVSRITWFDIPHYVKKPPTTRNRGTGEGYNSRNENHRGNRFPNDKRQQNFIHPNGNNFMGMLPSFMGVPPGVLPMPGMMMGNMGGNNNKKHGGVSSVTQSHCPTANVSPSSTHLTPDVNMMNMMNNMMMLNQTQGFTNSNRASNTNFNNMGACDNSTGCDNFSNKRHDNPTDKMSDMMGMNNQQQMMQHMMLQQMNNVSRNNNSNNNMNPTTFNHPMSLSGGPNMNVGHNNNNISRSQQQKMLFQQVVTQQQSENQKAQQQPMPQQQLQPQTPPQAAQPLQLPPGTVLIPVQNLPPGAVPIDVTW